jgi:hypothetical protein
MKRRSKQATSQQVAVSLIGNASPNPDITRNILLRVSNKPVTLSFLKSTQEEHLSEKHLDAQSRLREIANTKNTQHKIKELLHNSSNLPTVHGISNSQSQYFSE